SHARDYFLYRPTTVLVHLIGRCRRLAVVLDNAWPARELPVLVLAVSRRDPHCRGHCRGDSADDRSAGVHDQQRTAGITVSADEQPALLRPIAELGVRIITRKFHG